MCGNLPQHMQILCDMCDLSVICDQVREHLRHATLEAQAEASDRGREAVQLREAAKRDLERCK